MHAHKYNNPSEILPAVLEYVCVKISRLSLEQKVPPIQSSPTTLKTIRVWFFWNTLKNTNKQLKKGIFSKGEIEEIWESWKVICSILASREKQIEKIWNARKQSNLWERDKVSRKWKCCKFQWNVFVSILKCICAIHWVQISVKFCTASGRMPFLRLLRNLLRAKWICPEHASWKEN